MKREIKFRGLTKQGEWVYGWFVQMAGVSYIIPENQQFRHPEDPDFENSFVEVLPETVGQFTGLTDKNGVEVYEGDRVKGVTFDGVKIDGYVAFNDGAFCIKTDTATLYRWCDYDIEIIGNIHEQKERK